MSSSIMRFPKSPLLTCLAVLSRGVECGFMTAGATAAAYTAFQSVAIVLTWIKAL